MTTHITTLLEAEHYLRSKRAVIKRNGEDMIEGKTLLDACGCSYKRTKSKTVLDRQIAQHALIEGQDFTVFTHEDSRVRPIYHFTLNAANHICLAAMSP